MKLFAACCGTLAVFVVVAATWLYVWQRGERLAERWRWLGALGDRLWERRIERRNDEQEKKKFSNS